MTTETFPISIYFKVHNILNTDTNEILYPIVTISVNDVIHKENIVLNEPITVEHKSHGDHYFGELNKVTFNLDIDDDIEQSIKI